MRAMVSSTNMPSGTLSSVALRNRYVTKSDSFSLDRKNWISYFAYRTFGC